MFRTSSNCGNIFLTPIFPKDVWGNILYYTPAVELRKLPVVEKLWAEITRDIIESRHVSLKKMKFSSKIKMMNYAISMKLNSVNFSEVYDFNNEDLIKLVNSVQNLEGLTLERTKVNVAGIITVSTALQKLKRLNLGYISDISDPVIIEITNKTSQLQVLKLVNNFKISEHGLLNITSKLTSLGELCIEGIDSTDTVITSISEHLKKLKNLNIRGVQCTGSANLMSITSLTNLIKLNISRNQVSDDDFLKAAPHLSNLQTLNISSQDISDSVLSSLSKHVLHLNKLELCATNITDVGLFCLANSLQKLRALDLSMTDVTETGVLSITSQLTNIQKLNLWMTKVNGKAFADIVKPLKDLRKFHLGNKTIFDSDFKNLVPHLIHLETFWTCGIPVTDVELLGIPKYCTKLKKLYLWETQAVDSTIIAIATQLKNLELIQCRGPKFTQSSLKEIRQVKPHLEIDIQIKSFRIE